VQQKRQLRVALIDRGDRAVKLANVFDVLLRRYRLSRNAEPLIDQQAVEQHDVEPALSLRNVRQKLLEVRVLPQRKQIKSTGACAGVDADRSALVFVALEVFAEFIMSRRAFFVVREGIRIPVERARPARAEFFEI